MHAIWKRWHPFVLAKCLRVVALQRQRHTAENAAPIGKPQAAQLPRRRRAQRDKAATMTKQKKKSKQKKRETNGGDDALAKQAALDESRRRREAELAPDAAASGAGVRPPTYSAITMATRRGR